MGGLNGKFQSLNPSTTAESVQQGENVMLFQSLNPSTTQIKALHMQTVESFNRSIALNPSTTLMVRASRSPLACFNRSIALNPSTTRSWLDFRRSCASFNRSIALNPSTTPMVPSFSSCATVGFQSLNRAQSLYNPSG